MKINALPPRELATMTIHAKRVAIALASACISLWWLAGLVAKSHNVPTEVTEVTLKEAAGDYHTDIETETSELKIRIDGTYDLVTTDCLFTKISSGLLTTSGELLLMTETKSNAQRKTEIGRLRLYRFDGVKYIVPERQDQSFLKAFIAGEATRNSRYSAYYRTESP